MDLYGSVVVITGASSGIGERTAFQCATRGARLVLAARSGESLAALEQQITAMSGQALSVPTDVTDVEQVQHLTEAALERFGQIDVLVNNAGFGVFDTFTQARFTDLERMMQVNLFGMVRCTQAMVPHMLARRRGQIINIASIAGLIASPNLAFYNASKFAVMGMSRALRHDLTGSGVSCAIICPGMVHTAFFDQADRRKLSRATRMLPWLKPDDVARAIVRAVERDHSGEVILPAVARPLITLGRAFPGLAYHVTRLMG